MVFSRCVCGGEAVRGVEQADSKRIKQRISSKEQPGEGETATKRCSCHSSEWRMGTSAQHTSNYADFQCFESLGRRTSRGLRQAGSQLFSMASVLVFPTPPPGAQTPQTSSTPNPESHSNTCSDEYLEPCLFVETLGGAKVNFTCHNKASHWHRGQV